jgi:hypothetical protein
LKILALLALLAAPLAAEPDLRAAEKAIARGGGAEAYAERAAAKRALGRPFEDYIKDYAEAARRDQKYEERYEGVLAQHESQTNPAGAARKGREMAGEHDANALAKGLGIVAIAFVVLIAVIVLLRGRERRPLS